MPRKVDGAMVWTEKEEKRVIEALKAKGHDKPCRHCGQVNWSLNDGPAWIPIGSFDDPDRGHAHVHLVCLDCGETKLVSMFYLGLNEMIDPFIERSGKAVTK